jgi:hypothetical protein
MLWLIRILFVAGLLILSFLYGVATMEFQIFPYTWVNDAKVGAQAWYEILRDGVGQTLPRLHRGFEPGASPQPVVRQIAATRIEDDDLILISGGPYELAEHCPDFGCIAWLMDRSGEVVHAWEVDWDALWADTTGLAGWVEPFNIYPIGMHLFDNGDLVVTFQAYGTFPYAVGVIRLDKDGTLLWKRIDYSHHWPTGDADGRTYVPALRLIDSPVRIGETAEDIVCEGGKIYEEVVRVLSTDGEPVREYSIMQSLAESDYAGLLYGDGDLCDPIHLNSVALASPQTATQIPGVAAGDLLVSLRNPTVVAILDRDGGAVKHLVAGRTLTQHSPQFLPDGTVLVLDNFGGRKDQGGTRIVRLDLVSGAMATVYPTPESDLAGPLFTKSAGQLSISGDGRRALVAIGYQGRVIELDIASGTVTWDYVNTHDIGPFLDRSGFVAWLLRQVTPAPETTVARFFATGAYYVGRPGFLD